MIAFGSARPAGTDFGGWPPAEAYALNGLSEAEEAYPPLVPAPPPPQMAAAACETGHSAAAAVGTGSFATVPVAYVCGSAPRGDAPPVVAVPQSRLALDVFSQSPAAGGAKGKRRRSTFTEAGSGSFAASPPTTPRSETTGFRRVGLVRRNQSAPPLQTSMNCASEKPAALVDQQGSQALAGGDATAGEVNDAAAGEELSPEEAKRAADAAARKRSSRFRGVTKHRRSGRWEAHIWVRLHTARPRDPSPAIPIPHHPPHEPLCGCPAGRRCVSLASKSTWGGARLTLLLHSAPPLLGPRCQQHRRHENPPLGSYEQEEHAAEAFDVAAMKCKAGKVRLNYPVGKYADLIPLMQSCSLDELVMAVRRRPALRGRVGSGGGRRAAWKPRGNSRHAPLVPPPQIRRQSQGFARGTSAFRGVTRHPNSKWEARLGIPGSKHIYLGVFEDEDDAARAYDSALVRLRGPGAATNFLLGHYSRELALWEEKHAAGGQTIDDFESLVQCVEDQAPASRPPTTTIHQITDTLEELLEAKAYLTASLVDGSQATEAAGGGAFSAAELAMEIARTPQSLAPLMLSERPAPMSLNALERVAEDVPLDPSTPGAGGGGRGRSASGKPSAALRFRPTATGMKNTGEAEDMDGEVFDAGGSTMQNGAHIVLLGAAAE